MGKELGQARPTLLPSEWGGDGARVHNCVSIVPDFVQVHDLLIRCIAPRRDRGDQRAHVRSRPAMQRLPPELAQDRLEFGEDPYQIRFFATGERSADMARFDRRSSKNRRIRFNQVNESRERLSRRKILLLDTDEAIERVHVGLTSSLAIFTNVLRFHSAG